MSTQYKHSHEVPTAVLAKRLNELSDAVGKQGEERDRELTRRIPAELDRDADLVLSEAAQRLLKMEAERDALANRVDFLNQQNSAQQEQNDALAAHVDRLNEYAKACANELAALIDKHNVQSDSDGSWLYDHQTPHELMQVVLSTPESSLARLKAKWQAETNWINAADELPECDEDDEKCVLCSDGHRVFEEFAHLVLRGLSTGEITHWAPLPAPPGRQAEEEMK